VQSKTWYVRVTRLSHWVADGAPIVSHDAQFRGRE
jgi:hypothetical protein